MPLVLVAIGVLCVAVATAALAGWPVALLVVGLALVAAGADLNRRPSMPREDAP